MVIDFHVHHIAGENYLQSLIKEYSDWIYPTRDRFDKVKYRVEIPKKRKKEVR